MIMAISTEYINYSYFRSYIVFLKKIEMKYGQNCTLDTHGVFTFGYENTQSSKMYRSIPVYKDHRIFYKSPAAVVG